MSTYLVETFLPRGQVAQRAACEERAFAAAKELTRQGTSVRFDGAIYVPEDETCFFIFDAQSACDAALAATQARLGPFRIVQAAVFAEDRNAMPEVTYDHVPDRRPGVHR